MKKTFAILAVVFVLGTLMFSSCTPRIDKQIASLAQSIDKLEENYKDMTPNQIENAIERCERQLNALLDNESKLTKEQRKELSSLEGRYHRVLLKIQLYLMVNEIIDAAEVEPVIEYIKGLLGAS